MVWIHGGGFTHGSSRSYDPSVLVVLNDVIVVSINYRLGVLGFFNIPGTDVKGNYAMYDQACIIIQLYTDELGLERVQISGHILNMHYLRAFPAGNTQEAQHYTLLNTGNPK